MTLNDFLADILVTLPLFFLMGWACVLLLVDAFIPHRLKIWTAVLAALGLVISMVLVVLQINKGDQTAFNGMASVDGFSLFLQVVFLASGLAGIALGYDYLKRMDIERGEFYVLLLFSIGGMMSMSMANDLIMVFLSLEWLSIPLYILSAFARPRVDSEESGLKYFLLGAYSGGFTMYGIALVFGATATTSIPGIFVSLENFTANQGMLLVGAGLILVGLGFKVSAVPFHMWTPDVYQGAPTPVTGFMSVAAKAGGFAALLRVFVVALPGLSDSLVPLLWTLSALTMFLGNFVAIAQRNIKRMLSALYYLVAYAFTSIGAWAVVIALEKSAGLQESHGGLTLDDYAGLGRKHPMLAAAMAVFMLSFTGVPPTIGFMGKFYLFRTAVEGKLLGLALIGVLTSLVSAYYYLRVVAIMYMRPGEPVIRREWLLSLTVGATAVLVVLLSIFSTPLFTWVSQATLAGF